MCLEEAPRTTAVAKNLFLLIAVYAADKSTLDTALSNCSKASWRPLVTTIRHSSQPTRGAPVGRSVPGRSRQRSRPTSKIALSLSDAPNARLKVEQAQQLESQKLEVQKLVASCKPAARITGVAKTFAAPHRRLRAAQQGGAGQDPARARHHRARVRRGRSRARRSSGVLRAGHQRQRLRHRAGGTRAPSPLPPGPGHAPDHTDLGVHREAGAVLRGFGGLAARPLAAGRPATGGGSRSRPSRTGRRCRAGARPSWRRR